MSKKHYRGQNSRNFLHAGDKLYEILEGELLGDGSLRVNGRLSAYYRHWSKYPEYLKWLFGLLEEQGADWNGRITAREVIFEGYRSRVYHAATYSYRELGELQRKWYPNGKKIVPKDIKLTPTVLAHWHLGDGHLHKERKNGASWNQVSIATQSFTKEDVELLVDKLASIGVHANVNKYKGYIISFASKKDIRRFFAYMGDCPPAIKEVYGYKWLHQVCSHKPLESFF